MAAPAYRLNFLRSNRWLSGLAGAAGLAALVAAPQAALAADKDVTVTILKVRAIDKVDEFSKGDFYARVTIGGTVLTTQPVKQSNIDKPDWKLSTKVKPGKVDIKVEILDKDVTVDDPIDINKVDNKRALDMTLNTKSCSIKGFSKGYSCGDTITRTGQEKKAAEVAFKINVK